MSGFKCGPAVVNAGPSHFAAVCTWIACSPGVRFIRLSRIFTPCAAGESSAVPTLFPWPSLRSILTVAFCASLLRCESPASCANFKTKAAVLSFRDRPLPFRRNEILPLRCFFGDGFRIRRNCAGRYRGGVVDLSSQVKHERRDLEWHLLAFGHGAHRLGLQHFEFVVPRVHLDAPAERQRDNLSLGRRLRIGCGAWVARLLRGCRGGEPHIDGDAIAQVWADQIRDVFLPILQGVEEKFSRGELVLVG